MTEISSGIGLSAYSKKNRKVQIKSSSPRMTQYTGVVTTEIPLTLADMTEINRERNDSNTGVITTEISLDTGLTAQEEKRNNNQNKIQRIQNIAGDNAKQNERQVKHDERYVLEPDTRQINTRQPIKRTDRKGLYVQQKHLQHKTLGSVFCACFSQARKGKTMNKSHNNDYNDGEPFNGVPCKEDEFLYPVVATPEMKETLQNHDSIKVKSFNMHPHRANQPVPAYLIQIKEEEKEASRLYLNSETSRYLKGDDRHPWEEVSLDAIETSQMKSRKEAINNGIEEDHITRNTIDCKKEDDEDKQTDEKEKSSNETSSNKSISINRKFMYSHRIVSVEQLAVETVLVEDFFNTLMKIAGTEVAQIIAHLYYEDDKKEIYKAMFPHLKKSAGYARINKAIKIAQLLYNEKYR